MTRAELPSTSASHRLVSGTTVYATREGLLVSSARTRKLDLGSRAFEAELVSLLRSGADLRALRARYAPESVDRAIAALEGAGVITAGPRIRFVDLLSAGGEDAPAGASVIHDASELAAGDFLAALIGMADERLEPFLVRARELALPALVAWTDATSVAVAYADGQSRPCVECALLFDRRLRLPNLSASTDEAIRAAVKSGSYAQADRGPLQGVARSLLFALLHQRSSSLHAGEALILDGHAWAVTREKYPPHPSCRCQGPSVPSSHERRIESWEQAAPRRFAAVLCVDEGSDTRPARTMFRRSRSPWPTTADDFGIATAAGPDARLRAFAEGLERFCMLHARPDVRSVSARELGGSTLLDESIRMLLFRPEERSRANFRLPDYSTDLPLDWSWATHPSSGARVLVPTSLIGRPSAGSVRLVDTTSNGYAAHTDRDRAVELSLLEVIERDAVLRGWYASHEPVGIAGADELAAALPGVDIRAFLVTQDVDLPVVFLVARLNDGGLRACAAAAVDFEGAWRSARAELTAAVQGLDRPAGPSDFPDLGDERRRHGPEDHLRHYLYPDAARPVLSALWSRPSHETPGTLMRRWPRVDTGEALGKVLGALKAAHLDPWIVDRSLPDLFGSRWHVVRALVPGAVEISWGHAYRRLSSPRMAVDLVTRKLPLNAWPHPVA